MKTLNPVAALVLIAWLGATPVAASDAALSLADLSPGDRVRLRLSSGGKTVQGTVETTGADEFVVRPKDPAKPMVRVSPRLLEKLEVVTGKRSRWREGAIIGFVPGAVFMGLMTWALADCYGDCDNSGDVALSGLAGGAITGGLGALVGLAVKTDRWAPVATGRPRVALDLAPTKGGFRGNLRVSF